MQKRHLLKLMAEYCDSGRVEEYDSDLFQKLLESPILKKQKQEVYKNENSD